MGTVFDYYSDVFYTLCDYYNNNNIPDDLEHWDDDNKAEQIAQCYEEYEKYKLQKEIDALVEERSWQESFRYMSIQRIAREARGKTISTTLIFKFFNEYQIKLNEQVWFWMAYYDWKLDNVKDNKSMTALELNNLFDKIINQTKDAKRHWMVNPGAAVMELQIAKETINQIIKIINL